MATQTNSAVDVLADLIDALGSLDPNRAGALFADDGTFEFPYALPGMPKRVSGRTAVMKVLRGMVMFDRIELYDRDVHATDDSELVFATFNSRAQLGGRPYANRYICRARVRDGRILEYQEYFGPIPFVAAMPPHRRMTVLALCALPTNVTSWLLKRKSKRS